MGKKKGKVEAFVLDGSVAIAWCFQNETNSYADVIAARFPAVQAVVPAIWPLEVANVLLVGERRKRCAPLDTAYRLASLAALPITVEDISLTNVWNDVLNLARAQDLSVYDAAYLELALRRSLPLATLDNKLKDAALAVGVAMYKP
jgi:predicted nucleic acid-binding protein